MPEQRTAVIDLGSNSFRLVVFAARDGWWRRVDEIYEPVRIGAGLDESGTLGRKPMQRALAAVEVFAQFCRASGLANDDVDLVATSAIRDATNRDEFLDAVRATAGHEVRVLSTQEEAHYGYVAAVNSTTLADGAVLDLGGGSLQLVSVIGRHAADRHSWPLGAVRMSERFLTGGEPATRKQLKALRSHVAGALGGVDWLTGGGRRLVALGGTARNLAAAAQRLRSEPSFGVQGYTIGLEVLDELVELLAGMAAAERGGVPGIKPERGDLILAGAATIQAVVVAGGFDGVEVTEAGLREGVFFERLLAPADPPLFDDVRARSVLNLAGQYGVDPAHTEHVARLALGLFDDLAAAGLRPARARAAVGRVHRPRHRRRGRLRRPPQALALPRPQRRPARLQPARGRADRPGRPLPPQGHARRGAVRGAPRQGRRGPPGSLRDAAAARRGPRAQPRPGGARGARDRRRRRAADGARRLRRRQRPALGGRARGRPVRPRVRTPTRRGLSALSATAVGARVGPFPDREVARMPEETPDAVVDPQSTEYEPPAVAELRDDDGPVTASAMVLPIST
jgi:exopolyphosphatase/guanosine-5'-triphosphate,3'-diphosphate pyrophosphatase